MANPYSDLSGTYVTNNYMIPQAPFSQFGTRRLRLFLCEIDFGGDDNFSDWYDPNDAVNSWASSDPAPSFIQVSPTVTDGDTYFTKALRGIQLNAELYVVGQPAGDYFYFMIAEDTGLHNDDINMNSQKLADAIYDAINGDYDVYIDAKRFRGNSIWTMDETFMVAGSDTAPEARGVKSSKPSKASLKAAKK